MENAVFNASTYGIGQFLAQKKRLEVPLHQRNYSWGSSEVNQFLEDIFIAVDENYSSYFLGSVVITQPNEGNWGILDGQQRLTTASIAFSSIRWILKSLGNENDADQIEREFLGVRNFGGEYSTRLLLNSENRSIYNEIVVGECSDEDLREYERKNKNSRSNILLINAVQTCRQSIQDWSSTANYIENQVHKLYRLTSYLESKVKIVSIEVSDESDAYVVFETLNTRGQDLSALDLVKNYIYGNSDKNKHSRIDDFWIQMRSNIGESQADDFLRIFWMGNYGLIQKSRLYASLKNKFQNPNEVFDLASELEYGSGIYSAIEEPKHEFWNQYSPFCRHLLTSLKLLKSKQTRPILYACINHKNIQNLDLEKVLWILLVLTVRFQTIGRKRQGILEKTCARVAKSISDKESVDIPLIQAEISEILPTDEEFYQDFKSYKEINKMKSLYFLSTLEFAGHHERYSEIWERIDDVLDSKSDVSISYILPKAILETTHYNYSSFSEDLLDKTDSIFNQILINSRTNVELKNSGFDVVKYEYAQSPFWTTRKISEYNQWDSESFTDRSNELSNTAVQTWKIEL
jgi:uncharacterized protein with ParB-like and HNH nuclease domain